jgi:23S rRNA (uracil1939-C5)-methyltransferase
VSRRSGKRRKPPEPETGTVIDVTTAGEGIVDVEGKRVFVPGALTGEEVTFVRMRRRRGRDDGRLEAIHKESPARVEPGCTYFGMCGGCSLQHLGTEAQIELKQNALLAALDRIGKVKPGRILAPVSREPWGYRRRARLGVRHVFGKGRVLVGFRESFKPYITDMVDCEVIAPRAAQLLEPLSTLIDGLSVRARLPQIEVTVADNATALVFRILDPISADDESRLRDFARYENVQIFLQTGGPDTVAALVPEKPDPLYYELPEFDLRLEMAPTDFIQVNAAVNQAMINQAIELLAPQPGERVLDLFCGLGNFTLPLATRAGEVLGLEGADALVDKGRHNAAINGIENVRFETCDLADSEQFAAIAGGGFDALLLDPPRSGAAAVMENIAALDASRIVYVSCHPGSLARDLGQLVNEAGYELEAAGVLDMFPHTGHVESMAFLTRN